MKTCLVVRTGRSYNTIHTDQDFLNSIFKKFGRKIYDYFAQYRDTCTPEFKNGEVCYFVGRWRYDQYSNTYWMVTDGEKYGIIGREGILIEGKEDYIKFFDSIFKWGLNDDD